MLFEQRPTRDHDSWRAGAALDAARRHEALQELARRSNGDSLDGLDPAPLALEERHEAGEDGRAVHHHRAGAALAFPAAFLGSGEAQALAQHVEQALHGMAFGRGGLAVDGERDLHDADALMSRSGVAGISLICNPVAFSIA